MKNTGRPIKLETYEADIVEAYRNGETGTSIADRYGVKHNTVYELLRRNRIEIRARGGREKIYDEGFTQEFARLYRDGLNVRQIASQLNVGTGTVQRRLAALKATRPNGVRAKTITIPEDRGVLGYIAGLLDGEGNIQFKASGRHKTIGCKLQIYNTNQEVIEWLHANIGGGVMKQDRSKHGWKTCWVWSLYRARDMRMFLRAVLPFLIIKRNTAIAALALFDEILKEADDE